jgi:hypothetical protein
VALHESTRERLEGGATVDADEVIAELRLSRWEALWP